MIVAKSTPAIGSVIDLPTTTPPSSPPTTPSKSAPSSPHRHSMPSDTSVLSSPPHGNSLRKRLLKIVSPKHRGRVEKVDVAGECYYEDENHCQLKREEEEREVVLLVQLNISQYKIGVDWQNLCTLDKLGIIPNRYGLVDQRQHFNSLRLKTLKSKNQAAMPVIVRGVAPSSPAALTGRIQPGVGCYYNYD